MIAHSGVLRGIVELGRLARESTRPGAWSRCVAVMVTTIAERSRSNVSATPPTIGITCYGFDAPLVTTAPVAVARVRRKAMFAPRSVYSCT